MKIFTSIYNRIRTAKGLFFIIVLVFMLSTLLGCTCVSQKSAESPQASLECIKQDDGGNMPTSSTNISTENPCVDADRFTGLFADAQKLLKEELHFAECEDYKVIETTFQNEHNDIQYPQIVNCANLSDELLDKVNDTLYAATCEKFSDEDFSDRMSMAKIDYRIMYSERDMLSIYFWGNFANGYTDQPFCFGITLNMQTGNQHALDDFYKLDAITYAIKNQTFIPTRSDDVFWTTELAIQNSEIFANSLDFNGLERHWNDFLSQNLLLE